MFTYQVRQRQFGHPKGKELIFPNQVELIFHLHPLQLFGLGGPGGRTLFRKKGRSEHKVQINLNTGRHSWISGGSLTPLKYSFEEEGCQIKIRGNEFHIYEHCQSCSKLEERVQDLFFAIPILLNIEFFDPPIIEKVTGRVGDIPFVWKLSQFPTPLHLTDKDRQQKIIEVTLNRLITLSTFKHRRVIAALNYFHVACRLKATGNSSWEFMGEVLLNLAKTLEALFPPTGDGKTIDAARRGLKDLGYSDTEIQGDFIPAMVLRSHIDSAHISLFDLPREKLEILYEYTDRTEQKFQAMLRDLITKIQNGSYTSTPDSGPEGINEAIHIINKIESYRRKS